MLLPSVLAGMASVRERKAPDSGPGSPRPISAEERFVATVRRAGRKGRTVIWPPRVNPAGGVHRSRVVSKSPKAARKVACDATGRPSWKVGRR